MKKWNSTLSVYSDRHLHSFLAWFIAGVLLLAVITKLLDLSDFYLVLIQHAFVSAGIVHIAAAVIIGIELLIIVMLAVPALRPYGSFSAFLLFAGFTIFKAVHFVLDTGASCGCFGPLGPDTINFSSVLINIVLFIFCVFLKKKYTIGLKQS